jgi:hypothetical protein
MRKLKTAAVVLRELSAHELADQHPMEAIVGSDKLMLLTSTKHALAITSDHIVVQCKYCYSKRSQDFLTLTAAGQM